MNEKQKLEIEQLLIKLKVDASIKLGLYGEFVVTVQNSDISPRLRSKLKDSLFKISDEIVFINYYSSELKQKAYDILRSSKPLDFIQFSPNIDEIEAHHRTDSGQRILELVQDIAVGQCYHSKKIWNEDELLENASDYY